MEISFVVFFAFQWYLLVLNGNAFFFSLLIENANSMEAHAIATDWKLGGFCTFIRSSKVCVHCSVDPTIPDTYLLEIHTEFMSKITPRVWKSSEILLIYHFKDIFYWFSYLFLNISHFNKYYCPTYNRFYLNFSRMANIIFKNQKNVVRLEQFINVSGMNLMGWYSIFYVSPLFFLGKIDQTKW